MIKIEIKVDETLTYTFLEEDNLIEGFALKRQMDDDLTALNGAVECAEITCTLNNLYNEFNITSNTSPYSKLKNGLEVKAYSVSDITNNLFTGYLVDFVAPTDTDTQSCNLRAVDRLHILLNKEMVFNLQIERKISLFDYILRLFGANGVSPEEIEIDTDLSNIALDYTLLNGRVLSEQLNEICKATDAYIYVDKTGKIKVKSKNITGTTPIKTFSRADHSLISTEYGTSLFSSYNKLKVGYITTKLSEVKEVLSIGGLSVQVGENVLDAYELKVDNLYELDNIKITSTSNTYITELSATSSTITMHLNNPSSEEDIIDIVVYGKTIETADAFIERSVDSEKTDQSIEIKSILVQKKAYAEDLLGRLYNRAIEPIPYIKAEVEVIDFGVDLGYIVQVVDNEAEIDYMGYVHSIDIEYDGQGYSYYNLGIKALYKESDSV